MKLVIVESPTKSKTISHYLGDDYIVEASVGHVRDLAISGKGGLGIDINDNFKPTYSINKDKVSVVKQLKAKAKKADEVILATDPDREGEAIAWHLAEVLNLPIETTKRLEFHEITKNSILKAIEEPRTINMDLVHSQEARRIMDRIIGFRLSKLLQSKIKSQSAGRVQSATLGLICDHEKEILNFKSEEYWTIDASILKDEKAIKLNFVSLDGKKYDVLNKEDAQKILDSVSNSLKVSNISNNKKRVSSKEPFRTSTLEQSANSVLGFKTKVTAQIAQQLYEGVETDEGLVGLITYMRTDSTRISDSFVNDAKKFILDNYGKEYYKGIKKNDKDVKFSQDAHECIRPTSVFRTPKSVKAYLNDKQYKLYKLIYNRTLASLMSDKIVDVTTVTFDSNDVKFETKGSINDFVGYDILKIDEDEKELLPTFVVGEKVEFDKIEKVQNFTKPPLRYSEGKLVKIMEEDGIGRPSTYSSTIQTLILRKYLTSEKGGLIPTEQGILTSNVLKKYFPDLMSVEYTAKLELDLDKVQIGELNELELIQKFYSSFEETFEDAKNKIYKEPLKTTGEKCPECGGDLVIRHGRFGDFVSCSNYPECHYVKKEEKEVKLVGKNCPECGSPLVYRKNKKGQTFIGCSNFPKCHYIEGEEDSILKNAPVKVCPECGGELKLRKYRKSYFYGCSNYPKCKYNEPYEKK